MTTHCEKLVELYKQFYKVYDASIDTLCLTRTLFPPTSHIQDNLLLDLLNIIGYMGTQEELKSTAIQLLELEEREQGRWDLDLRKIQQLIRYLQRDDIDWDTFLNMFNHMCPALPCNHYMMTSTVFVPALVSQLLNLES